MANQTKISNTSIIESQDQGFQGFIRQDLMTATTTTGTPAAGTFYSSITNRASMQDLSKNLRVQMGVERIVIQSVYQLQNEFGPNGEPVFIALNDSLGQIRFAGNWSNLNDISGAYASSGAIGDFVEITFYGTGLNIVSLTTATARDVRASIDGGTESANIYGTGSSSAILNGRNYAVNMITNVTSNLTLGVHTVKLRTAALANSPLVYGFEILNEATVLKVNKGTSYLAGQKRVLAQAQDHAVTSGYDLITRDGATQVSTSTRGGRVLVYQKSDATVGKAIIEANSAQGNFAGANHTNEEPIRTYHFREFGVGRADDFSLLGLTPRTAAFTLDDGTTTLASNNCFVSNASTSKESFGIQSASDFITITFVGTGLDGINGRNDGATLGVTSVLVDGTSIGNIPTITLSGTKTIKIVSGLPYGTHTVKILYTSGSDIRWAGFVVYGPKKPSLPSGAVELADYNITGNWSFTGAGVNVVTPAAIRKQISLREAVYVGAGWLFSTLNPTNYVGGWEVYTPTSGQYMEYTFFGTGFELRGDANTAFTSSILVTITGNGRATPNSGAGLTFNAAGGYAGVAVTPMEFRQNVSTTQGSVWSVLGLALGTYTVRLTNNNANPMVIESFDIVTPIHSPKSNIYADLQNTLTVGSNGISDNRQFTPIKNDTPSKKAWAQAIGIQGSITTTSASAVPINDLSLTVKTNGGPLDISFEIAARNSAFGNSTYFQIFIDGVGQQPATDYLAQSANGEMTQTGRRIIPVSAGVHKVDLYWSNNGGTSLAFGNYRVLTVKEL